MPRKSSSYTPDDETDICLPEGVDRKSLHACMSKDDSLTQYGVPAGAAVVGRRLAEGDQPASGSICALRCEKKWPGLLLVKKVCQGKKGGLLLIDDRGKHEVNTSEVEIVAVGLYACTCHRDGRKCAPAPFDVTADDTARAVLERLRVFYAPETWVDTGHLNKVSRRLFKLAERVGIENVRARKIFERHMLYAEAVERGQFDTYDERDLRRTLAQSEAWSRDITGAQESSAAKGETLKEEGLRGRGKAKRPAARAKSAERGRAVWKIVLQHSYPHLGFIAGDVTEARRVDPSDVKAWDILSLWCHGDDGGATTGRVLSLTDESVTIRACTQVFTFNYAELEFIGRVSPEPVKHDPDHALTDDARARVEDLERQIEKLGNEDDQILRCTRRYELEKEIYDIRHPIIKGEADDPDPNDWSAWEGDE